MFLKLTLRGYGLQFPLKTGLRERSDTVKYWIESALGRQRVHEHITELLLKFYYDK